MAALTSCGKRTLATFFVVLALSATIASTASALPQVQQRQQLGPVATAVATQFAKVGASYLVTQMQGGKFGSVGTTIGNLLGPFVQDPSVVTQAQLDEIKQQLEGISSGLKQVHTSLSGLAKDVIDTQFSLSVANAAKITALIDRSMADLDVIANSTSVKEREEKRADLLVRLGPSGGLDAAQETLRNYLVAGVPGAQGILYASLKLVRAHATPFITNGFAAGPEAVLKYYGMYQSMLLALRINYLNAKHATAPTVEKEVNAFWADLGAERGVFQNRYVWPQTALDTRTQLLWSGGYERPNHGQFDHMFRPLQNYGYASNAYAAFGNQSGGIWQAPTVDQLRQLVRDATTTPTQWLVHKAAFPAGVGPWVWTDQPGQVFNLNTGAVESRPLTDKTIGAIASSYAIVNQPHLQYP